MRVSAGMIGVCRLSRTEGGCFGGLLSNLAIGHAPSTNGLA